MKKHILIIFTLALIVGFATWLYSYDKAAMPGGLISTHEAFNDCGICHVPWRGVDDRMCRRCHVFRDTSALKPQIRFHEAGKYCLECHTEHLGPGGNVSRMNHTVLSDGLECTQCHVDPHASKFGSDCRQCHGINSWEIEGFRHPPDENRNCHRCHEAPESHYHDDFWQQILEAHSEWRREKIPPSPEECRRCHITHRWDHLRMPHDL